ncbi:Mite allergen Der p7 [Sarcoptes scabiei]|nr:Mite allergen Der p7 [Sarcoptes scabiei]
MTTMAMKYLLLILFRIDLILSVRIELENLPINCGYSKCPTLDSRKINVHLIPHTHDDVGWLKTVDQYYYGSRNEIQNAGVQYILDTVVEELIMNKDRRFIYVETAFFWKWWLEQDNRTRSIVNELVQSGQLEFVNGGWSMPDEACTHYNSLIDQSTLGLKRLNQAFGECGRPKVTWQIDPFGHSKELASLYAQMGYDAIYFAREDYQDRYKRQSSRELEHVWISSADLGNHSNIFAGMMQMGYGPPRYLDWDLIGGLDEPIIDNSDSEEYNVPWILNKFISLVKNYSTYYATNNLLFPMGTDFNYQNARSWFKNMDKLIAAVASSSDSGVNVFYSTPLCYTKALYDYNRTWTVKYDDYFPYASDPHAYWTGYFTSRPALKRMERIGNNWLQVCKQLDVLAMNHFKLDRNITILKEAMGVMQHHDAVAGTEKQHVAYDYARMLSKGIKSCQSVIASSFDRFFGRSESDYSYTVFCNNLNISSCWLTESGHSFSVTLYNPLLQDRLNMTVRLPIKDHLHYEVFDSVGVSIPSVLVEIADFIRYLPERKSSNSFELVFRVSLNSLSLTRYFVKVSPNPSKHSARIIRGKLLPNSLNLKGKSFDLKFDSNKHLMKVKILGSQDPISIRNEFRFYIGAQGNNLNQLNRSSGAYIFRPQRQRSFSAGRLIEEKIFLDTEYGLVQEIHQKFDSYIGQIIRVDPNREDIEFDFTVGSIPVQDGLGKEIITVYRSALKNHGIFFTDSNGRQMISRKRNYRPTWNLTLKEPIAANYYPVTSKISIKDTSRNIQMTILNDRSQGGSSLEDGSIELMIHRRLLHDDGFGVDEALNEPGFNDKGLVIRGKHSLLLSKTNDAARRYRKLSKEILLEPIMGFHKLSDQFDFDEPRWHKRRSFSRAKSWPKNVHLLTLEQWSNEEILVRFEHIFQKDEDSNLSKPVRIDLKNLFESLTIVEVKEMTLAANQDVSSLEKRLYFKHKSSNDNANIENIRRPNTKDIKLMEFELYPMQIRTFILRYKN